MNYQYELFSQGILARGGIAYGKHFYEDGFMFSLGLIEAYNQEKNIAKYPRIVVSKDLISLLYENSIDNNLSLLLENDGLYFVDYLKNIQIERKQQHIKFIFLNLNTINSSVKEKYIWLSQYYEYKDPGSGLPNMRFMNIREG